jgi:hypothetical protein
MAAHYGGWPHEVAAFPLSYYLIVRDSYLREVGLLKSSKPKSSLPFEQEGDPEAFQ